MDSTFTPNGKQHPLQVRGDGGREEFADRKPQRANRLIAFKSPELDLSRSWLDSDELLPIRRNCCIFAIASIWMFLWMLPCLFRHAAGHFHETNRVVSVEVIED